MSNFEADLQAWRQWRDSRTAAVTSPQGNLALVETTWYSNGENFDEQEILHDQPSTVIATELVRRDFDGNIVAQGHRLWDRQSEAIVNFLKIDTFEFNPDWVVEGRFTPFSEAKPIPFEYVRDNGGTRDLAVPGEIAVVIAGEEYFLHAFDDDGQLLLVFADPTNGSETYSSGRFLFVDRIPNTDLIYLDFNRAFVPPCGFSIHYNCPLPPVQNRIHIAVPAGEKKPIFTFETDH